MFLKTVNWLFTTLQESGSFWGRLMHRAFPPVVHIHSDLNGLSVIKLS